MKVPRGNLMSVQVLYLNQQSEKPLAVNPKSHACKQQLRSLPPPLLLACSSLAQLRTATLKGACKYACSVLIPKEVPFSLQSLPPVLCSSSCPFSQGRGSESPCTSPRAPHMPWAHMPPPRSTIPLHPTSKHDPWARHYKLSRKGSPQCPAKPQKGCSSPGGAREPQGSCTRAGRCSGAPVPLGTQGQTLA